MKPPPPHKLPTPTFTAPDPLAGSLTDPAGGERLSVPYISWLSPYAYCASDPINFTDPSGMLFINEKEFEKLTGAINRRKKELQTDLVKQTNKKEQQKAKGKDTKKIDKRISEINEQSKLLDNVLEAIELMRDDPENSYKLEQTNEEAHFVYKDGKGTVKIQHTGAPLAVHEIVHVKHFYDRGLPLDFSNNMLVYPTRKVGNMVKYEIEAYQAQLAMDPYSLPISVPYLDDINAFYLYKLYKQFGSYEFAKTYLEN